MLAAGCMARRFVTTRTMPCASPAMSPGRTRCRCTAPGKAAERAATLGTKATALVRGSSTRGKLRANTALFQCTTCGALRKLRYSVSASSGTAPMPSWRAPRKLPTSASRKPYMDCIGSPTTNRVRPSPASQPAVSCASRRVCSREVSWNSSTRMWRMWLSRRSARSVGSSPLPSAAPAACAMAG